MIARLAIPLGLIAALWASAALGQPSYSCDGSLTATERAICADPALARLDSAMSNLHAVAAGDRRSAADPAAALAAFRTAQRAWIGNRNACGADTGCLRASYLERIGALGAEIGATPPAAGPRRVGDIEVGPDGTMERRYADGSRSVRNANGSYRRFAPDGTEYTANVTMSQTQAPTLPVLPNELTGWGDTVNSRLAGVIRNILTPDEYAAYQATETDKDFFDLVEWRLNSITFLTSDP